ncbi:MAG: HDIG domain-containing protein [Chloroflexi bacterium]|nr:HDIG domain-containing protein [Chloroflexota bacterium]
MVTDGEPKITWQERFWDFIEGSILWLFIIVLTVSITGILTVNTSLAPQLNVKEGQPSPVQIVAPRSVVFESEELTRKARELAAATIEDVYDPPSLTIGRSQNDLARNVFAFIDTVRADNLASPATKINYLRAISDIRIESEVAEDLVTMNNEAYDTAKADVLRIIQVMMRDQVRDIDLTETRRQARLQTSFELSPQQERVVTSLAPQFIVANSFFNEEQTQTERQAAVDLIPPQPQEIRQGEMIVRVGELLNNEHIEILSELDLLQQERRWQDVVSIFTASLLAVMFITLYWQQFHPRLREIVRYWFLFGLLILLFMLAARLMIPGRTATAFIYPAAALSLLLAIIFDRRLALIVTIVLATIVGIIANNSLEMAVYTATGGLLAVLTLRDTIRINAVFRAGLMAALGNMSVILIFRLPQNIEGVELAELLALGLLSGLIAASLTIGGFYLAGSLFGVITTVQLQDLSRLDHPLLKELLRRAPGTYHHSIMVANLAEQAAERIKANSTLVRVGAFYHDVGKMNRPPFFTENQDGPNPHDSLDPYSSARIIISHVTDGLTLAKQSRLPDRIRDFIAEHHGTRVVAMFYKKAQALTSEEGGEPVDKKRFQYPGPRPRSRETAIVAMADAVEAASSAIRPDTEAAIEKLVNSIVEDHLKESQLDNCGLTLGDLKQIRESFSETLKGRFHVRVKYPGNEELMNSEPPPALLVNEPGENGTPNRAAASSATPRPVINS